MKINIKWPDDLSDAIFQKMHKDWMSTKLWEMITDKSLLCKVQEHKSGVYDVSVKIDPYQTRLNYMS